MVSVLFIDSDKDLHASLRFVLPIEFSLLSAYSGESATDILRSESPEIIVLNTYLPDVNGTKLLETITAAQYHPPVIMTSEEDDIPTITRLMRMGAYDYLKKPFGPKELKSCVLNALRFKSAEQEKTDREAFHPAAAKIIGESDKIRKLKRQLVRYAPSDHPVLITGESGTGKEIVASTIHELSCRSGGPFVTFNCGAMPPTLLHSELFGSEKGGFTDAVRRQGLFEQADQGSVFLDEIGEMDGAAQVQLLRVLECREVKRIGSTKKIRVDIRIITATNKNLPEAINRREFRQDLYYRINTLYLHLPPLRERKKDIPLLAKHFISAAGSGEHVLTLGSLQKLTDYNWPGNVRELKAAVERALLLTDSGKIEAKHIVFNQSA